MLQKNEKFEKDISELIKHNLKYYSEFEEHIERYANSKEFLKFAVDSVIRAIDSLMNTNDDYAILSLVILDSDKMNAKEVFSSFHLNNRDFMKIFYAVYKHKRFLESQNAQIILQQFKLFNLKEENRIILDSNDSEHDYSFPYYKNVA